MSGFYYDAVRVSRPGSGRLAVSRRAGRRHESADAARDADESNWSARNRARRSPSMGTSLSLVAHATIKNYGIPGLVTICACLARHPKIRFSSCD